MTTVKLALLQSSSPAANEPLLIQSIVESSWLKALVVLAAYAITMLFSGVLITKFIPSTHSSSELITAPEEPPPHTTEERRKLGNLIGKCENIIIVTLVLAKAETGLALIFAAKTLVRSEDIKNDPGYFLGGTLLNFAWSLVVAMLARALIMGL